MRRARISRFPGGMSQSCRCYGNDLAPFSPPHGAATGHHTTFDSHCPVTTPAKRAAGATPLTGCIRTKIPFFQRVGRQPKRRMRNGAADADEPANKTKEAKARADDPPSG